MVHDTHTRRGCIAVDLYVMYDAALVKDPFRDKWRDIQVVNRPLRLLEELSAVPRRGNGAWHKVIVMEFVAKIQQLYDTAKCFKIKMKKNI